MNALKTVIKFTNFQLGSEESLVFSLYTDQLAMEKVFLYHVLCVEKSLKNMIYDGKHTTATNG